MVKSWSLEIMASKKVSSGKNILTFLGFDSSQRCSTESFPLLSDVRIAFYTRVTCLDGLQEIKEKGLCASLIPCGVDKRNTNDNEFNAKGKLESDRTCPKNP
jgi:hypothetical protein